MYLLFVIMLQVWLIIIWKLTNNHSSSLTPIMASTSDAALKEEIARLTGDLAFLLGYCF
jgi:hypothetical protein